MAKDLISGSTKVLGVFGYPVGHSRSPQMQNAAICSMGLDYCYVPFPVHPTRLEQAVEAIRALGIVGVNVTIPHKISVIQYLDVLSKEAELIGAVNTIHNNQGVLYGYNTDGQGFIQSLIRDGNVDPKDKNIVILGAGGAARGISVSLALRGSTQLVVAARNQVQAVRLADDLAKVNPNCRCIAVGLKEPRLKTLIQDSHILVDTTPVGMYPNIAEPPVIDGSFFHRELLVCDLVYNPMRTSLLVEAEKIGAPVLGGVGMLAYQGALALQIWTGREPPFDLMKDVLIKSLQEQS